MGKKLLVEDRKKISLQKVITSNAQMKGYSKSCDLESRVKAGLLNRQERRCIKHSLKAKAKNGKIALKSITRPQKISPCD